MNPFGHVDAATQARITTICAAITLTFFKKEDLDLSYHIKAVHMYRQLEKKRKKKGNDQRHSKGGETNTKGGRYWDGLKLED